MQKNIELFIRRESSKEYIKQYPVVASLILINTIIFLITVFDGGSTNTETLVKYGAYSRQNVIEGEWYRFITPMFLHIGLTHFILNTAAIAIFTVDIEKMFGSLKYLLIYFMSGLGGTVAVYMFSQANVAAGASGAIYGMFGAYLYMAINKRFSIDKEVKKFIITLIVINLVITFLIPSVSALGHLGGLITGFLVSTLVLKSTKYHLGF